MRRRYQIDVTCDFKYLQLHCFFYHCITHLVVCWRRSDAVSQNTCTMSREPFMYLLCSPYCVHLSCCLQAKIRHLTNTCTMSREPFLYLLHSPILLFACKDQIGRAHV